MQQVVLHITQLHIRIILPILDHSCLVAAAPAVQGVAYLIVNSLQFMHSILQSICQSNILAIVLPLMLLRSGIKSIIMYAAQCQIASFRKKLKTFKGIASLSTVQSQETSYF